MSYLILFLVALYIVVGADVFWEGIKDIRKEFVFSRKYNIPHGFGFWLGAFLLAIIASVTWPILALFMFLSWVANKLSGREE